MRNVGKAAEMLRKTQRGFPRFQAGYGGERGETLLSTQVLQEFYVAVTCKLAVPLDEIVAERALCDLALLPVISVSPSMILSAVGRSRRDRLSFWDALMIESALCGHADRVYTEDLQHGRVFDGVQIENPFLGMADPPVQ